MQPDEAFRAAEEKAAALPPMTGALEPELERLRSDCVRFFAELPEPPVYARKDDPAREKARRLIPQAEALFARALAITRAGAAEESIGALREALRGHLAALCHVAAGRLLAAERTWADAQVYERKAVSARRLFIRSDEVPTKVYDRGSGASRYDPAPESAVRVKLACPAPSCHHIDDFAFSPRHSTHQFQCPSCKASFVAYFGEVRSAQVTDDARAKVRHYLYRLQEMGGGLSRIEFEDASGGDFLVSRQDLLAFIYSTDRELRGVLNLSSSRLLWLRRGGACFLATVAFGEGAPELAAFRAFRDDVLRRTETGAALVRLYYRHGPAAARWLQRRPRTLGATRRLLSGVHRALEWRAER